ncbi:hypothetical protein [Pedobacter frigoris]|uniref:RNA recognition motif domain-containing protein n=1 Tax=Pedobacter frigoris TaxID=2571272 RepID=UPI00292D0C9E|nr:hypothetical protein [Pedobacter frigoris]
MAKVFVVGFPFETDEVALKALFDPFGEIGWVNIIIDKETGKSLGYGFVMFPEKDAADKAIEALDGSNIGDRKISVKAAFNKQKPVKRMSLQETEVPALQNLQKETQTDLPRKKRPRIRL